jgi:hypothetical protein
MTNAKQHLPGDGTMKRHNTLSLIASLIPLLAMNATAQPELVWSRVYGDANHESPQAMVAAPDGGTVITGAKWTGEDMGYDVQLLKVDPAGEPIWNVIIGGPGQQYSNDVVVTPDGGYLVAGASIEPGGWWKMLAMKFDGNGELLWELLWGTQHGDEYTIFSIVPTDGGYFLAGLGIRYGNQNCFIMKITESGEMLWTRSYGDQNNNVIEVVFDAIPISDGGIALAGYYWDYRNVDYSDLFIMRLSAAGGVKFMKHYGNEDIEIAYKLIQTPDNGFIAAGIRSTDQPNHYIVRIDEYGNLIWERTYGTQESLEYAKWLANRPEGGFLMGGFTSEIGAGDYDFQLMALDDEGNVEWNGAYGGEMADMCIDVLPTEDGGFLMMGETESFGNGGAFTSDIWLIKVAFPPDGVIPEPDQSLPMALKVSPAYPNPFNAMTAVEYSTGSQAPVNVALQTLTGETIRAWSESGGQQQRGVVNVDAAALAAGTYWLRLEQNGKIALRRVVLVR